jgi:hypothetical protein
MPSLFRIVVIAYRLNRDGRQKREDELEAATLQPNKTSTNCA